MITAVWSLTKAFEEESKSYDWSDREKEIWKTALDMAKECIHHERRDIENAYKQGCKDTYGIDEPSPSDPDDSKEAANYYKQTFKQ